MINDVYRPDAANELTVHYWFQRFHSGNLDLKTWTAVDESEEIDSDSGSKFI